MITLIVLFFLSVAIYISFSEMKEYKAKEAFRNGFLITTGLFVMVSGGIIAMFLVGCLLLLLLAGIAWIFTNMP